MSLLDDYSELEKKMDLGALQIYFKELSRQDAPAHFQAWRDILEEEFDDASYEEKCAYLRALQISLPNYSMWDPELIYLIEQNEFVATYVGEEYREWIRKTPKDSYRWVIAVNGLVQTLDAQRFIKSMIQKYIDDLKLITSGAFNDEMRDVLKMLNNADPYHHRSCSIDVVESISATMVIKKALFAYHKLALVNKFNDGAFREEYYLFDLTEEFARKCTEIKSKYQEIKDYLKSLIDICIKTPDI
jgi:hypothetical protein